MHSSYRLILQMGFYMFWAMKVYYQEVNCRIQALWYNVMSQVCTVISVYYKMEYIHNNNNSPQHHTYLDITLGHNACILQLTS